MVEVNTAEQIDVKDSGVAVAYVTNNVEVEKATDLDIRVTKKEYSIVGDDIYIPQLYDDAPQWMKDLVQLVVDVSLTSGTTDLVNQLNATLSAFATSYVPLNQYTQSIISLQDADTVINNLITTLNSTYNDGISTLSGQIIELQSTKASASEVVAQVISTINSELISPTSNLSATIGNLQQTIANESSARVVNFETISSTLETLDGEISGNATAITNLETSVTNINNTLVAQASDITALNTELSNGTSTWASADSNLENSLMTEITDEGARVESKFAYNSNVNINGVWKKSGFGLTTNYVSGSGTQADPYVSEFWIDASRLKFTNSNQTGQVAPFTIDATGSQPQVTFNGKVTFGSGQTGTIDEAITAVVETVAVGDKNINITDNLIPTTSLVADTENSGYQFVGTPVKSMAAGLESFSEAQIALDGSDEVYSPYVDEVTIPYYYRFGVKGITNLTVFKIVTIDSNNIISYNNVTVTIEAGQSLSAANWYTVDGIINPIGGTTTADGDIRDINGIKVGSINNFVITSGTTKILLGWIADCTISRMKMCKITADTITSDFSSVNGQLTNLQNQIDNVDVSGNINANNDAFAMAQGFASYADMVTKYSALGKSIVTGGYINTGLVKADSILANSISADRLMAGTNSSTVWTGGGLVSQNFNGNPYGNIGSPTQGFRLSSGAVGTETDPNIYGAYIKGGTIDGLTVLSTFFNADDIKIKSISDATKSGRISYTVTSGSFVGSNYSTGYLANRVCSTTSYIVIHAKSSVNSGSQSPALSASLQYSVSGGAWVTIDSGRFSISNSSNTAGGAEVMVSMFAIVQGDIIGATDTITFRVTASAPQGGTPVNKWIATVYNQ